MGPRPNFLLFITDQQRADHLGCYGNPVLRTPAVDSLAKRGVAFDNFFVASPVCQPNRATLATGRMPSLHGVRMNGISLSYHATTFVELLRAAGWRTALIGKSHLQNTTGQETSMQRPHPHPRPGFAAPPPGLDEAEKDDPAEFYEQENRKRWAADPAHSVRLPFYGFDHVELCSGHAARTHGAYARWLAERHPDPDSLRGPENGLPGNTYSLPQAWRTGLPEELYPTSYVEERTIAYLEEHAVLGGGAPFFIQCSFPDPHHPFTPPGRYWDLYKPEDVDLPEAFDLGNHSPPPHVARLHAERDSGARNADTQAAFAVTEREAREAIALTYGMITMVDDAIGRIITRLEALGLAENTVIVFTSDHGDLMGDHQLMLKGYFGYRGLIRVPFICVDPSAASAAGQRSQALVGTLDLARTLLERARVEPYNGIQGRSFLNALGGDAELGHDSILIEYGVQRPLPGTQGESVMRTLVDRRWRITFYHGVPWGELYDLSNDPHEKHNLWDEPAGVVIKGELAQRMIRRTMELSERSPWPRYRA